MPRKSEKQHAEWAERGRRVLVCSLYVGNRSLHQAVRGENVRTEIEVVVPVGMRRRRARSSSTKPSTVMPVRALP
jgi:hypothetical protein